MAFSYGFFDSINLDRVYTAEDFTGYLSHLICNGILDTYGDCFSMKSNNDLTITIGTGRAWINGHYFCNNSAYTIDLSSYVNESLARYVAIGISCDTSDSARLCQLEITAGLAANAPSIPAFINTDEKTYLTLGAVYLSAGTTSISKSNIRDYRNTNKCGYVRCILGKCKVSEILDKLDDYNSTVTKLNEKITTLQERLTEVEEVSGSTGVVLVSAGQCGEKVFYALYSNGNLKLTGTGATYDYDNGKSVFYENDTIKSVSVGDGITELGKYLFQYCTEIKSASLPSTLTFLHQGAFYQPDTKIGVTAGLTEVTLPNNLKTIGKAAFAHNALEEITVPASVTEWESYAFTDCSKLKKVTVESSLIGSFAFTHCFALSELVISKNCKSIGENILTYCSSLKSIKYLGTISQWNGITKPNNWMSSGTHYYNDYLQEIVCTDGKLTWNSTTYAWEEST